MPTDVATAENRVRANTLIQYYGFIPEREYVLRSRHRAYHGVTRRRYRFANGECIAPRMKSVATEQQKWDRGERLSWFRDNPGYRIYERGTEPPANEEPMWFGQALPDEAMALDDSGEEFRWNAAAGVESAIPNAPITSYPVAPLDDSGEANPSVQSRKIPPFKVSAAEE